MRHRCHIASACFLAFSILLLAPVREAFQETALQWKLPSLQHKMPQKRYAFSTALNEKKADYSRDLYLREEAESPFRKVRFFFYITLGGGAVISLFVSVTRLAAALSGINRDLLPESATNAAIDVAGIVVLAFLYSRDLQAQESRLKRASKGAELAKLSIKCSKNIASGEVDMNDRADTFTTSLASLRRGRGIEKRVVIAAANANKIQDVLNQATILKEQLSIADLVIVPVVLPSGAAPDVMMGSDEALPDCIALPVGNAWSTFVADEMEEAAKQGIDAQEEGLCVILKKNGRVGQRTKGIRLDRMVGEVTERRDLGFDVSNV